MITRRSFIRALSALGLGAVIPVKAIAQITSTCSTGSSCSHSASSDDLEQLTGFEALGRDTIKGVVEGFRNCTANIEGCSICDVECYDYALTKEEIDWFLSWEGPSHGRIVTLA